MYNKTVKPLHIYKSFSLQTC